MPQKTLYSIKPAIYSISCKNPKIKDIYIGSCNNYNNRFKEHKYGAIHDIKHRRVNQMLVYKTIRACGGWDNWIMKVEEYVPNHTWEERRELEQIYIDFLKPTLNKCRAIGFDDNRKKIYDKAYSSQKVFCPICNMLMSRKSLRRHIKNKHPHMMTTIYKD